MLDVDSDREAVVPVQGKADGNKAGGWSAMEGVLFVRKRRSKLLHTWQKRYVVLSRDGVLKEYAEASAARAIAGSGMALKQELAIHGAEVVALPFPLAGRPHAFRVKRKKTVRVTLAAKNADQMNQWMDALRAVCSVALDDGESPRERSPAMWGHAATGIRRALFTQDGMDAPWMELSVAPPPRSSEQDFMDILVHNVDDLAQLLQVTEWNNHRLRTRSDWSLDRVPLVRGSMVVAVNGISLQTLSEDEVGVMLKRPSRLPVTLRWLKSPHKRGILKCKLCYGLTTQLKTIAMYRNGLRAWKEQIVEIDGDVLTCQPKADGGKESNRSVIPLVGGCTVKSVHEIVAEQKCCFLVSVKAYSMLFQASSQEDLVQWIDAIQRAINIAEGCIPGFDLTLDDLQLESSVNMRSRGMLLPGSLWATSTTARVPQDLGIDDSDSSSNEGGEDSSSDVGDDAEIASASFGLEPVQRSSEFPDDQLSGMLEFLQATGRFIEALQLMSSESSQRAAYWRSIFRWAVDPVERSNFDAMLQEELNASDSVQVLKDVPRTSKWLAGSPGAPVLSDEKTRRRLGALQAVLHAFLISCESDTRTDARARSSMELVDGKSFYMQGMNGIAFIILEVMHDDEVAGLELLRGVITHILPHVFGIRTVQSNGDNFDLFSSLIEVGNVLDEVVQMHLPNFHEAMEHAGLPVCLLAYKWFPTLFSDISLMAHRSQLRYDTLLSIWDVCLLMGIEGMFCVALALFSAAEEEVVTLRGKNASTETISATIITVLASIGPQDLIISVCEVIELCSHPVLLKLRNGHRRRLQQHTEAATRSPPKSRGVGASPAKDTPTVGGVTPHSEPETKPQCSPAGVGMTVRDLDSGKLFRISNTGSMLLPVKPSDSRG